MTEQNLRRTPQQARSQQRVEEILRATADLLVEDGYERLTTSAIAKRAGISVGSLYQFFANKDAILQALAGRYLEKMAILNEVVFTPDAVYVPIPILIDRAVDALVAFVDKNQGIHQLFDTPWILPELQTVADEATNQMIVEVQKIVLGKAPHLSEARAFVVAQALLQMIKGMLSLVETAVPEERPPLITEFKRMGVTYLEAAIADSSESPA